MKNAWNADICLFKFQIGHIDEPAQFIIKCILEMIRKILNAILMAMLVYMFNITETFIMQYTNNLIRH